MADIIFVDKLSHEDLHVGTAIVKELTAEKLGERLVRLAVYPTEFSKGAYEATIFEAARRLLGNP